MTARIAQRHSTGLAPPGTCTTLAVLGLVSLTAPARAAPHLPEPPKLERRLLDLRPPAAVNLPAPPRAATRATAAGPQAAVFAPTPAAEEGANQALRGIGAAFRRSRDVSGVENWARQLHHDGLTLARPWENHAAFLSLGLSPRGKPGLWLVQKTH